MALQQPLEGTGPSPEPHPGASFFRQPLVGSGRCNSPANRRDPCCTPEGSRALTGPRFWDMEPKSALGWGMVVGAGVPYSTPEREGSGQGCTEGPTCGGSWGCTRGPCHPSTRRYDAQLYGRMTGVATEGQTLGSFKSPCRRAMSTEQTSALRLPGEHHGHRRAQNSLRAGHVLVDPDRWGRVSSQPHTRIMATLSSAPPPPFQSDFRCHLPSLLALAATP